MSVVQSFQYGPVASGIVQINNKNMEKYLFKSKFLIIFGNHCHCILWAKEQGTILISVYNLKLIHVAWGTLTFVMTLYQPLV